MQFLILFVIGTAVGLLGARVMRVDLGALPNIAVGMIGTIFGLLILRMIPAVLGLVAGLIAAFAATLILFWAYKRFLEGRGPR